MDDGGISPAVQTIFGLSSPKDMKKHMEKTLNGKFSLDDAEDLLKKWRKELTKTIHEFKLEKTEVNIWTADSGSDVLDRFSSGNVVLLIVGYILMVLYAGLAFGNIKSIVRSRINVGLVGVAFVCLALTAGLGTSAMIGLKFNPTTTRVLPFLVLGLGVDDMFVLAHAFFHVFDDPKCKGLPMSEITRKCLEKVGHSITLTSVTNSAGFLLAAVIPVPAMREFALQVAICIIIDYFVLLFAFPAYLAVDGRRIRRQLPDGLCCCEAPECLHRDDSDQQAAVKKPPRTESRVGLTVMNQQTYRPLSDTATWGDRFVNCIYSPLIRNEVMNVVVVVITLILIGFSGYGVILVKDGLDLPEIVPAGTREYDFVVANTKYFSFSSVTIAYDEHNNFHTAKWQKAALEFHREFAKVKWITKHVNDTGHVFGVSEPFWLELMIGFYANLQKRHDDELLVDGKLSRFMMGLKHLFNVSLDKRWEIVDTYENVTVIPEKEFYRYVTAWMGLDLVSPRASLPSFRPEPPYWHPTLGTIVPEAEPLVYTQMPFYAKGLSDSREEIGLLKAVRSIIDRAKADGISAYPRGQTFTYYEQYINLRRHLYVAIAAILGACFLATSFLLLSIRSGIIMAIMLLLTAFEVYGFLGLAGIQFSAIPCVSVIVSVGATVEFTAPLCLMFVKIAGSRDVRVHYSLMYRFIPIFNGAVSTFLGFVMLSFADFEFIIKYFLFVFLALLVLGTFNGLVLLPVVLYWVGPPPQVFLIPGNDADGKGLQKEENGVEAEVPIAHGLEFVVDENIV
jgi:predicted RND superfamily exporter protein